MACIAKLGVRSGEQGAQQAARSVQRPYILCTNASNAIFPHLRIIMKHHLSTLSILHYVYGALICMMGLALLVLVLLGTFLNSDWMQQQAEGGLPPFLGILLSTIGWVLFFLVELQGVLNLVSAARIGQRRGRTFSQVVAAFNCFNIPFGIALGIFTFVVLGNSEVQACYAQQASGPQGGLR